MESTSEGVPRFGLRVALGAVTLALGWLVVGAISGGDSASAVGMPPLAPDALSVADAPDAAMLAPVFGDSPFGHTSAPGLVDPRGLADPTARVVASAAATAAIVDSSPGAADDLLTTLPAVPEVTGPNPIQGLTAPVVHVATDVLDQVADTVDLAAVSGILPEVLGPVLDTVSVHTLVGDLGSASTLESPAPASSVLNDLSSMSLSHPPVPDATFAASEPVPWPTQPSAPATPADAMAPTASVSFAVECDLSRSRWAILASGSAVLPPRNDDLPSPPAFDFDPTPD